MIEPCFLAAPLFISSPASHLPRHRQKRSRCRPSTRSLTVTARFNSSGQQSQRGEGGESKRLGPRPDAVDPPPPFIPQTMEYAIRQAQSDVADALLSAHTRLNVELPMGRSRRHWYRMSPMSLWYTEAASHALHFAEMFQGLRVCIVLGCEAPDMQTEVPWLADARRVEDGPPPPPPSAKAPSPKTSPSSPTSGTSAKPISNGDDGQEVPLEDATRTVIIIAAAQSDQRDMVQRIVNETPWAEAVVLLNCFLGDPLDDGNQLEGGFRTAYACRALDKVAVLRRGVRAAWSVFVEIAVFEYEWVGDRDAVVTVGSNNNALGGQSSGNGNSNGSGGAGVGDGSAEIVEEVEVWMPTQAKVEQFAVSRGACRKALSSYYETGFAGCEAGFWPFMTLACRDVRPLDGIAMERAAHARQTKKKKKATRPFGFF